MYDGLNFAGHRQVLQKIIVFFFFLPFQQRLHYREFLHLAPPSPHQYKFFDLFRVTPCVSAGVSLSHTALIISCEAQGEGTALLTDPFKGSTVEREMKVGQEKRPKLKRASAASACAHRRLAPPRLPPRSISTRVAAIFQSSRVRR